MRLPVLLLLTLSAICRVVPAEAQPSPVQQAETALSQLGYPVGVIDGVIDDALYSAIRQWQSDRGLPMTGRLTLADLQNMQAELAQRASPPAPASPTFAPVVASTTGVGQVPYHQIADCPSRRGFGILNFSEETTERVELSDIWEYHFTDFCFDAASGLLQAGPYAITDLVLTEQSSLISRYAAIARTVSGYRDEVSISAAQPQLNGHRIPGGVNLLVGSTSYPSSLTGYDLRLASGFILESDDADGPPSPQYGGPFSLLLRGLDVPLGPNDALPVDMPVNLLFDGLVGQGSVPDGVRSFDGSTAVGTLAVNVGQDGWTTSGTGRFTWQSGVLAGADGNDWESAEFEITALRGRLTGPTAEVLWLYVVVLGTMTTFDGQTFRAVGDGVFQGYTDFLAENWYQ